MLKIFLLNKLFAFRILHLMDFMVVAILNASFLHHKASRSHPNPTIESQMIKQKIHGHGHHICILKNLLNDSSAQPGLKAKE